MKGGAKKSNTSTIQKKARKTLCAITSKLNGTEKKTSIDFKRLSTTQAKPISKKTRRGLQNLGNTFYMSAVMQCLKGCKLLSQEISMTNNSDESRLRLLRRMKVLFQEIGHQELTEAWKPKTIFDEICTWKRCQHWKDKKQQDAGELLRIVIQQLTEENKTVGKLFLAKQNNTTRWLVCKTETWQEVASAMLALNVEDKKPATREELLQSYARWQTLTEGNEFNCLICKKRTNANRRTSVVYGPNILAMQLTRFKRTETNGIATTAKVDTKVQFKERLRLECKRSTIAQQQNYRLRGIIEHKGTSTENGHYVAYVREGNEWTQWDDEDGTPLNWETVAEKEAYLLLWEREEDWRAENPDRSKHTDQMDNDEEAITRNRGEINVELPNDNNQQRGTTKSTDQSKRMNIEEEANWDSGKKGVKRSLEAQPNVMTGKQKTAEKVKVKRPRAERVDLQENSEQRSQKDEVPEKCGRWTRKPPTPNKSNTWHEGVTPIRGGTDIRLGNENQMKAVDGPKPTENSNGGEWTIETLIKITKGTMNQVAELWTKVDEQNLEIISLKRNLRALKTKVNARMLDDDEECFIDEGMYTEDLPVITTPVDLEAAKVICGANNQHAQNITTEIPEPSVHCDGRLDSENMPQNEKTTIREMEIEYNEEREIEEQNNTGWQPKRKTPHYDYLEDCFIKQIGLPLDKPQNIGIYSFKDKRVASGYMRIVTTWQGMYYELMEDQVEWKNLQKRRITIERDLRWDAEGITVYNPIRELSLSAVVRHRFAMLPPKGSFRIPLRTDRYYIHVYQAKIGHWRRTLSSRSIARELKQRY